MSSAEKGLEPCPSCGEPARMFTVPDRVAHCGNARCDGALPPAAWNRAALSAEAFALLERWVRARMVLDSYFELPSETEALLARVAPEPEPVDFRGMDPEQATDIASVLEMDRAPGPETNTEEK